jgi:hypothetical protein
MRWVLDRPVEPGDNSQFEAQSRKIFYDCDGPTLDKDSRFDSYANDSGESGETFPEWG